MRVRILGWSSFFVLALAVWLGFGFFGAQRACASDPRFACSPRGPQNAVLISDPAKSWTYYGRLAPGERDVYGFLVNRPMSIPVSVSIEKADSATAARPVLTVVDGRGKVVATRSLRGLTSEKTALSVQPGLYQAFVDVREGSGAQRYALAIGSEERIEPSEIPYVLGALWRVRMVGY